MVEIGIMRAQYTNCRTRLARIRCLSECIEDFKHCQRLPYALCYACKDVEFECSSSFLESHSEIKTHAFPISQLDDSDNESSLTASLQGVIPIGAIACDENTKLYGSSEPMVTRYGLWLKIVAVRKPKIFSRAHLQCLFSSDCHCCSLKVRQSAVSNTEAEEDGLVLKEFDPPVWVLAQGPSADENAYIVPVNKTHELSSALAGEWKNNDNSNIDRFVPLLSITRPGSRLV